MDWSDKARVLAAVKQDGWALRHVAEPLQADKEVVMAAVRQHGSALEYAAEPLRAAACELRAGHGLRRRGGDHSSIGI